MAGLRCGLPSFAPNIAELMRSRSGHWGGGAGLVPVDPFRYVCMILVHRLNCCCSTSMDGGLSRAPDRFLSDLGHRLCCSFYFRRRRRRQLLGSPAKKGMGPSNCLCHLKVWPNLGLFRAIIDRVRGIRIRASPTFVLLTRAQTKLL